MEENTEIVLSPRQQVVDQVAVTVLGGLAGLFASKMVDRGYKAAVTAYRLRRATA